MDFEDVVKEIVDAALKVHTLTGPGLWEKVYEFALTCELDKRGFKVDRQVRFDFHYEDRRLCDAVRVDLVVEQCVLVEMKSVEIVSSLYLQQCSTYLAVTGLPAGLLLNFNVTRMKDGIKRCYPPRRVYGRTHYTGNIPVEPSEEE